MRLFFRYATALFTLCATTQLAAANAPTTAPSYATPADVIAACQKAGRAGDYQTLVDCYSPEGMKQATEFCIDILVSDAPTGPSTQPTPQPILALEKKYGLDRPRRPGESDDLFEARLADAITDKRAFLIEAAGIFGDQNQANNNPPSELINVNISSDGKTAVAKLVQKDPDGSAMTQDVKFTKIDGSWKLDQVISF
jgi:hypothetical protein